MCYNIVLILCARAVCILVLVLIYGVYSNAYTHNNYCSNTALLLAVAVVYTFPPSATSLPSVLPSFSELAAFRGGALGALAAGGALPAVCPIPLLYILYYNTEYHT